MTSVAPLVGAAVLVSGLASLPAEAKVPSEFRAERYGARCDGRSDDTGAIQSALDAAADAGGGIVRIPATGSDCVVYWHLEIGSRTTVIFEGSKIRFGALPWNAGEPYRSRRGFRGTVISARRSGQPSSDIVIVDPKIDAGNLAGLNGIGVGSTSEVASDGTGTGVSRVEIRGGLIENVRMGQYYGGGKALTVQRGASDVTFRGVRVRNAANVISVVASKRNRLKGTDSPLAGEATLEYALGILFEDLEVDGCGTLIEVLDLHEPNEADDTTMRVTVRNVRARNCGSSMFNYEPAMSLPVNSVTLGPGGAAFSAREDVVGMRSGAQARLAFMLSPGLGNAGRRVAAMTLKPMAGAFVVGETVKGSSGEARAVVTGLPSFYRSTTGRGVMYFDGGVNFTVENVVVANGPDYPKVGGLFRGRVRDSVFRDIAFSGDCRAVFNGEAGDIGANVNYPDSFAHWRGNRFESILHRGDCEYLIDSSDVGEEAFYKSYDNRFHSICYRPERFGSGILGPDRIRRRGVEVQLAPPGSKICGRLAARLDGVGS